MKTINILQQFFSKGTLPDVRSRLESKKELKADFKKRFKKILGDDVSPLLAFQVLYHRLSEIAQVAKEVFYEDAVKWAQTHEPDDEGYLLGAKVTIKVQEDWDVVPSPKIMTLKKEISKLEKKNASVLKAYENYQTDVKSLNSQIKAEQERLIEKGMAKKKGEKHIISLKY